MREREVTRRIAERLKAEGVLNMTVRYQQEHGPDIEAELPDTRKKLYIEAKGERPGGQETAKRRVALGEALFQILSVYDLDVICVIALPYTKGYQDLVKRIMPGLRQLHLHVLFVGADGIWHLSPKTNGFFPTKPVLLLEALC